MTLAQEAAKETTDKYFVCLVCKFLSFLILKISHVTNYRSATYIIQSCTFVVGYMPYTTT